MAKGVKLTNEKSSVPVPINPSTEAFEQKAVEASVRINEYKSRAWELGVKFKSIIESSILPENKTPMLKDLENETLNQLSKLATDINLDESQLEGSGGVILSQLIMKMLIVQKDMFNQQKFRIEQLEKAVSKLQEK